MRAAGEPAEREDQDALCVAPYRVAKADTAFSVTEQATKTAVVSAAADRGYDRGYGGGVPSSTPPRPPVRRHHVAPAPAFNNPARQDARSTSGGCALWSRYCVRPSEACGSTAGGRESCRKRQQVRVGHTYTATIDAITAACQTPVAARDAVDSPTHAVRPPATQYVPVDHLTERRQHA